MAGDLVGRLLVRRLGDEVLVGRIVECEAYQEDDPASHSFQGLTGRNRVMFGPPGHLYVYFSYGMHHCMNVVTGREGVGSAVLLRAVEPLVGVDRMRALRGVHDPRALCSGPGRLTRAFAIDRSHDGIDLVAGDHLFLAPGRPVPPERLGVGPRVGISSAVERPWRFFEAGSAFVSRGPRAARPAGAGRGVRTG